MYWDDISNLHNKGVQPWVIVGDFNEILYSYEKEGGNARPITMIKDFSSLSCQMWFRRFGFCRQSFYMEKRRCEGKTR